MSEPLTPLEALKQLQPLFPWANWIALSSDGCSYTSWVIYENMPFDQKRLKEAFEHTSLTTSTTHGRQFKLGYEYLNIEWDGNSCADSLFTTTKEDE